MIQTQDPLGRGHFGPGALFEKLRKEPSAIATYLFSYTGRKMM